ncbi:hypothetical protein [Alistipes putredinis]|uniref:hypothetical protein n=1 Tax=Alistipes putredinis TaxID=28117 RepID=UPI003A88446C
MTNQVTSIEQSKRLLELGVPAEKASMAWAQCSGEWHLSVLPHYTASKEYIDSGISIPAFTVTDLLEMLPAVITYGRLYITRSSYSKGEDWRVFYKRVGVSKRSIISFGDHTLIVPACNMIEWVVSNGYKLNV